MKVQVLKLRMEIEDVSKLPNQSAKNNRRPLMGLKHVQHSERDKRTRKRATTCPFS